jgi:hypothetical protein
MFKFENEFHEWLSYKYGDGEDQKGTINSRKANYSTVCKYEGDLEDHFLKNGCQTLLARLTYTAEDKRHNRKQKHKIPITGDIKNGTATYKSVVNLYIKFRKDMENGTVPPPPLVREPRTGRKGPSNWPEWEMPEDEEMYQLARTAIKYVRFLKPEIIEAVTEDNLNHYDEWRDLLKINNIDPDLYLWELSPCCFPGIRRHEGAKEIAYVRKQGKIDGIPNALKLDDNDFPKQIWSFVFTGKQFSKSGPVGYSLAHLVDHKKEKNRIEKELKFTGEENYPQPPYYGLYTCPSNAIYILNSLLRPTDFNSTLRRLLFQKAESLYKDCCNILPPFIKIPEPENEKWNIQNFEWGECVGNMDNISTFLTFRNKKMSKFIQTHASDDTTE